MAQVIGKTEAEKQTAGEKYWNAFIDRCNLTHMASLIRAGEFSAAQIERAMGSFVG